MSHRYRGVQHGFLAMLDYVAPAKAALGDCTAFLRKHLHAIA